MSTQEIIQALIKDQLIENAKMQANDHNFGKLSMLIAIATDKVATVDELLDVTYELDKNASLYQA
jgi:hypothetical protein